jgi:hypothetical protein
MTRFGLAFVVAASMLFGQPARSLAWGFEGHRLITRAALALLPPEVAACCRDDEDFIVEHTVDPDLWRILDLRTARGAEAPNHFFDIDGLGEPRPYSRVPRRWEDFRAKYGAQRTEAIGRLPWQAADFSARLVDAFRDAGRTGAMDRIRILMAVLAHYVEDAFVPFHAVVNYDGQLTGQQGIHARFETGLVLRYSAALTLRPRPVHPVPDVTDFLFEILVRSESLATAVLTADRAAAGSPAYDDRYFDRLWTATRPVVEGQMSDAATAVASVVTTAWTAAGRPVLRPRGPSFRAVGGRGTTP